MFWVSRLPLMISLFGEKQKDDVVIETYEALVLALKQN